MTDFIEGEGAKHERLGTKIGKLKEEMSRLKKLEVRLLEEDEFKRSHLQHQAIGQSVWRECPGGSYPGSLRLLFCRVLRRISGR
jgi:hypothetical protein